MIKLRIEELLKENNINQKELADISGLQPSTISDMTRGIRSVVNLHALENIMEALHLRDFNRVLSFVDENEKENIESTPKVIRNSHFKVFSMFDGVGGFGVGLENANQKLNKDVYQILHTNQYEPAKKVQDAFAVGLYTNPGIKHSNTDIMKVPDSYFDEIKKDGVNMIVAGFPCQDYSVARSLSKEKGIEGKKGVLFWEIIRAVKHIKPEYLILENVDRLLKSPSKQRGRDFAIMLGAFNQLNYSVEWRVINAADYGRRQRRRRVFFFVYRNDSKFAQQIDNKYENLEETSFFEDYILYTGLFAKGFPVEHTPKENKRYSQILSTLDSENDDYIVDISDNFTGTIWNSGVMRNGKYYTLETIPVFEKPITLQETIDAARNYYDSKYGNGAYEQYIQKYIIHDEDKIAKFKYLRGPKKIMRKSADGHEYIYSEGGMSETDNLNLPSRTMLTSEGSVNRSTHFIKYGDDQYRLLTPIETELLQDFPPEWTKFKKNENGIVEEVSDRMRYFFMGNALVTGIVTRIGTELELLTEK